MSALGELHGRKSRPARKCKSCGNDIIGSGQRCKPCAADRIDEQRRARDRVAEKRRADARLETARLAAKATAP